MSKCYNLLFLLLLLVLPAFTYAQIDPADTIDKVPATGIGFFAGIGAVSSSVSFSGDDKLNGAKKSGIVSPQINAGADIYFDTHKKTLFIRIALSYNPGSKTTLTTTYGDDNSGGTSLTQTTETLKFTQSTVSLTPQLIWNFYDTNKFKAYIDAGFGLYVDMFSNKNYTVTSHYSTSGTTTTVQRAFPEMNSVVYNIPVQVGITLSNKFNIYAGYMPRTSLNPALGFSIDNTRYQAGVNYLFGGK